MSDKIFVGTPLWVYIEQDPDIGNQWVSHVLTLDVVTQADTIYESIYMATDASLTLIEDVFAVGKWNPRQLPNSYWDKFMHVMRTSHGLDKMHIYNTDIDDVDTDIISVVAELRVSPVSPGNYKYTIQPTSSIGKNFIVSAEPNVRIRYK